MYNEIYTKNIQGNTLSYDRIQCMTKTYKTHRNIFDIEKKSLNAN